MTKRRTFTAWTTVLLGLALASCSSDDNGPPPPATSLQGHFQLFLETVQPVMSPEVGPTPYYFDQNGAVLNGLGGSGTVSGMNVSFTSSDPNFLLQMVGTANAPTNPTVTGTFTISGGFTASGNLRLEPLMPTGMLTANGALSGNTIAVNSSVAIGQRLYDDTALTMLNGIGVTHTEADMEFDLEFTNPAALMVGTLSVPALPVTVSLTENIVLTEANATGGNVTVTKYDGTGFTATYSLMIGSEMVTGSFDVVWDINAYDP